MTTEHMGHSQGSKLHEKLEKVDAVGWGLFLVWIGIAFLLDVGKGIGLLGISIIILGVQFVRKNMGLQFEGFWVIVGVGAFVAAVSELSNLEIPIGPIVIILIGVGILASIVKRKQHS